MMKDVLELYMQNDSVEVFELVINYINTCIEIKDYSDNILHGINEFKNIALVRMSENQNSTAIVGMCDRYIKDFNDNIITHDKFMTKYQMERLMIH